MRTLIRGGTLITPCEQLPNHTLVIEEGRILAIESGEPAAAQEDRVIDAGTGFVTPGFIDVHVHGALGNDTMDASSKSIHGMARCFAKQGVTSYLPTTLSASGEDILRTVEFLAHCPQAREGAQHMGVHIEGPYLNPQHRGAHPAEQIRNPHPEEYRSWLETGAVRLVTLAPEQEGALDFIDLAVPMGVEFAIGHSGATYPQVVEAADHGLRQATHTFNGMLGLHHRRPGTVGGVLDDDRIYAQIIPDGIHLHPATVKLLIRVKGVRRTILVTDAISAAGLEDGEYQLGGLKIIMQDGISRTATGALAGSTLTMDAAVRNAMQFAGVSLADAVTMATSVPAEAMGWSERKGVLAPGADADITILDEQLNVMMTMVAGNIVHQIA